MPFDPTTLDLVLVMRVRKRGGILETEVGLFDGDHARDAKARYDAQVKDKRRRYRMDAILGSGGPTEGDADGWITTFSSINTFATLPALDTPHWHGDWK